LQTIDRFLRLRELKGFWLLVATAPGVIVLTEYLAVAPVGSGIFLSVQILYVLCLFPALAGIVIFPFLLLFKRHRAGFSGWFLLCLMDAPLIFGGFLWGRKVRMKAFDDLALRSVPLVDGIHRYGRDEGHPPARLSALLPKYLPAVPDTGMMACPEFKYETGARAGRYGRNPWILRIPVSSGGINFDEFLYFPLQNYPERGHGGSFGRIRDWAYLHE